MAPKEVFAAMKSLSTVMAILALCGGTLAQSDRIKVNGDFVIGTVMPVRSSFPGCTNIDIGSLLKVEAMFYAVQNINQRAAALGLNGSLGLDIRDTCAGTYQAMMDLVMRSHPGGAVDPRLIAVTGDLPLDVQEHQNSLMLLLSREITHVSCDATAVTSNAYIAASEKIFHVNPSERTSVEAIADLVSKYQWAYVGLIGDTGSEYLVSEFRSEANANDICVGMNYTIDADVSEQQLKDFVTRLDAERNFTVVVLFTAHAITRRLLTEASRQKLTGMTWVMGQRSWPNTAPIALPNMAAQGMFVIETHTSLSGFEDYLRSLPTGNTKINNHWLRELSAIGASDDSENTTATPPTASPTPCDLNVDPLCGLDRQRLSTIVSQMIDRIEEAACSLDAVATVARGLVAREKCRNSSYCPQERTAFHELVRGLDFVSPLTEHQISFSKRGYLKQTKYQVYNYQQNYSRISSGEMSKLKAVDVGVWYQAADSKSTLTIDQDRVEWHGGGKERPASRCHEICPEGKFRSRKKERYGAECCWECAKCPDMTYTDGKDAMSCKKCSEKHRPNLAQTECVAYYEDYVHWEHPGALFMLFLIVVGICFALYINFVLFRYSDTPVVRKAKSAILTLLPLTVILFLLPIPLLSKPTEASCEGYRLFFLFVLGVPLAVLISRSQYFDNKCYDPVNGSASCTWKCLGPRALVTSFVIGLHIIFALILTFLLPVKVDRLPTDDPFTVFLECNYHSSYQFLVLIFYIMVMAVLVTIFSFNEVIDEENNYEVKWISFAMFNWYAITFFYVVFQFGLYRKEKIILLALMDFFYAVNLLGFLYLPKWYIITFRPEKNRGDASPWSAYVKNQEKVSERLSAPEDSPVMAKRGQTGTSESPEAQGLIADTDI